jgi:hypothetical protein
VIASVVRNGRAIRFRFCFEWKPWPDTHNPFDCLPRIAERFWRGYSNLCQGACACSGDLQVGLSRSGLNAHLDRKTRFIKILAFKTAKVARISELI